MQSLCNHYRIFVQGRLTLLEINRSPVMGSIDEVGSGFVR